MTSNLLSFGLLMTALAPADLGQNERRDYSAMTFVNLEGTVWKIQASAVDDMIWHFERAGVLRYNYANRDEQLRNATWKQDGDSVYIEFNNKYAEYRGTFRGDVIEGTASNINGTKWTWSAKRH
jgi:hypothetical protein